MQVKSPLCLVAILLSLSLISACSGNGMSKLNGKWVVDRDALSKMVTSNRPVPSLEEGPILAQFLDILADEIALDFDTSKQEVRKKINGQELVLTYTVVSESSKEIKIKVNGLISVITMTGKDSFSFHEGDSNMGIPMIRAKN